MIEIIPNWHPVFVHFTIGLLLTAALLFLAGYFMRNRMAGRHATVAARWNLGIGAVVAVLTVATGLQAYYTLAHDTPAHEAMTIHLSWALATLALFLVAAGLAWRDRQRTAGAGTPLSVVLFAGAVSLAVTGYLGAENVYRHGLGVMRLPETSGPGHGHPQDGGTHQVAEEQTHEYEDSPERELPESEDAGHDHDRPVTPESALDAFHHALEEGNEQAALRWLSADALILEGGGVETRDEYASHHLGSDMAFLSAMNSERLSRDIQAGDDLVTIITRSRLTGTFKDKEIDVVSSETAVLTQAGDDWQIQHLHWSSD